MAVRRGILGLGAASAVKPDILGLGRHPRSRAASPVKPDILGLGGSPVKQNIPGLGRHPRSNRTFPVKPGVCGQTRHSRSNQASPVKPNIPGQTRHPWSKAPPLTGFVLPCQKAVPLSELSKPAFRGGSAGREV